MLSPAFAAPLALSIGALSQAPAPVAAAAPGTLTLPAFTGYAHPDPERIDRDKDGTVKRCDGELVFYVRLAHAGELHVDLETTAAAPSQQVQVTVAPNLIAPDPVTSDTVATDTGAPNPGADAMSRSLAAGAGTTSFGPFVIHATGYHRIRLRAADGAPLRHLRQVQLRGPAAAGAFANRLERRNAASVHLGYPVPKEHEDEIEWFYCEVTPRTDPLWTYYMATGWHRGYFGMQVNSPTERRLIFSVWDAGNEAADRDKVAAANRVELLAKGDGVFADGFGNEGTGGHSHLVHDWRLGGTFRFLVHAEPDGDRTVYTGWFWFAERASWGLIASFRAPKDGRCLRGLYSFSENFSGANGDAPRDCEFGNVWTRTRGGTWLPMRTARFTHDGTGDRDRLDRGGGARETAFFLRHGDFAEPPAGAATRAGTTITALAPQGQHPADAELPRVELPRVAPPPSDPPAGEPRKQ